MTNADEIGDIALVILEDIDVRDAEPGIRLNGILAALATELERQGYTQADGAAFVAGFLKTWEDASREGCA